jgi:hypothetical protein
MTMDLPPLPAKSAVAGTKALRISRLYVRTRDSARIWNATSEPNFPVSTCYAVKRYVGWEIGEKASEPKLGGEYRERGREDGSYAKQSQTPLERHATKELARTLHIAYHR